MNAKVCPHCEHALELPEGEANCPQCGKEIAPADGDSFAAGLFDGPTTAVGAAAAAGGASLKGVMDELSDLAASVTGSDDDADEGAAEPVAAQTELDFGAPAEVEVDALDDDVLSEFAAPSDEVDTPIIDVPETDFDAFEVESSDALAETIELPDGPRMAQPTVPVELPEGDVSTKDVVSVAEVPHGAEPEMPLIDAAETVDEDLGLDELVSVDDGPRMAMPSVPEVTVDLDDESPEIDVDLDPLAEIDADAEIEPAAEISPAIDLEPALEVETSEVDVDLPDVDLEAEAPEIAIDGIDDEPADIELLPVAVDEDALDLDTTDLGIDGSDIDGSGIDGSDIDGSDVGLEDVVSEQAEVESQVDDFLDPEDDEQPDETEAAGIETEAAGMETEAAGMDFDAEPVADAPLDIDLGDEIDSDLDPHGEGDVHVDLEEMVESPIDSAEEVAGSILGGTDEPVLGDFTPEKKGLPTKLIAGGLAAVAGAGALAYFGLPMLMGGAEDSNKPVGRTAMVQKPALDPSFSDPAPQPPAEQVAAAPSMDPLDATASPDADPTDLAVADPSTDLAPADPTIVPDPAAVLDPAPSVEPSVTLDPMPAPAATSETVPDAIAAALDPPAIPAVPVGADPAIFDPRLQTAQQAFTAVDKANPQSNLGALRDFYIAMAAVAETSAGGLSAEQQSQVDGMLNSVVEQRAMWMILGKIAPSWEKSAKRSNNGFVVFGGIGGQANEQALAGHSSVGVTWLNKEKPLSIYGPSEQIQSLLGKKALIIGAIEDAPEGIQAEGTVVKLGGVQTIQ